MAMHIIQTLILGAVEGFTEFLPISSTAHMMMASRIMRFADKDFLKTFEIVIQFGAILAIVAIYWPRLYALRKIWKQIVAAFIPTGIIGLILYKYVKDFLGNNSLAIWALGIGGALMILFEIFHKDTHSTQETIDEIAGMPYIKAVAIGCAQAIAIIPGVSRSAATIVAGRALGISRKAIVEFSFLLAVPTIFAASGYELVKGGAALSMGQYGYILIGFGTAFITAYISVRWFLKYIQTHNFISFGIYRIIIALIFILFP